MCSLVNWSWVVTATHFQKVMETGLVWLRPCLLPPKWVTASDFLFTVGDKCLTQNELSTCGPVPHPQAFPCVPLAADSPALTVPSLLVSLVYGSSGDQSCWKRERRPCQTTSWVNDEPLVEPISASKYSDRPGDQHPDTRSHLKTQTVFFSFMIGCCQSYIPDDKSIDQKSLLFIE